MKRDQKILSAIIRTAVIISAGTLLMIPTAGSGQSNTGMVTSQESVRDPFLLPPGIHFLPKPGSGPGGKGGSSETETTPREFMKVNAILIADHIRLATIDHQIVTEGDTVHGETILEIQPDRVILGKGDQKRNLLLSQSPVQITIDEIKENTDENEN